jgi:hypothetical protein
MTNDRRITSNAMLGHYRTPHVIAEAAITKWSVGKQKACSSAILWAAASAGHCLNAVRLRLWLGKRSLINLPRQKPCAGFCPISIESAQKRDYDLSSSRAWTESWPGLPFELTFNELMFNEKISSVEQPKTFAKIRASGRLGT